MTENEAKIFIQNAMEQSKKALAELLLISPKVFAVRKKNLGEYYSNLENCKKEIQSCEVAIKALEEVQRWHTSVINPNIKNEFANTSTQICHNCDHKDEYIEELEAEVEEYRAIGTPEELQEMKKDFAEALSDWRQYRKVGTLEECRAAVEKQTAKKPMHVTNSYFGYQKHKEHVGYCPDCGHQVEEPYGCPNCLRKIDWGDEE
jgi:hypothetical protein